MYKRAQSTHKLPVHSAKGFANFSASLAMLPPTCLFCSCDESTAQAQFRLNLFFSWHSTSTKSPVSAHLSRPFVGSDVQRVYTVSSVAQAQAQFRLNLPLVTPICWQRRTKGIQRRVKGSHMCWADRHCWISR